MLDRGYLIPADNTKDVDYINCARALARSIRIHTPFAKISILTSDPSLVHNKGNLFDSVIAFPFGDQCPDSTWKLKNDWQVFYASPYRQTIKLEADMIIPHSIEHWFDMFQKRDVVVTTGTRNYLNEKSNVRYYRKLFDENNLPDVYNAITYWRRSTTAQQFFDTVRTIFDNWDTVKTTIKGGDKDPGSTDVVYAIAAKIIGIDKVTLPDTTYPTLIHMKGKINYLAKEDWTKELVYELDKANVRVNTVDQMYPWHYCIKDFGTVLNKYYDTL